MSVLALAALLAGALGADRPQNLIRNVRSARQPAPRADSGVDTGVVEAPPAPPDPPLTGQEVYLARCVYCHGGDARGTPDGPDLRAPLADQPSAALVGRVRAGVGAMPPQDVRALEAWRALEHARGLAGAP